MKIGALLLLLVLPFSASAFIGDSKTEIEAKYGTGELDTTTADSYYYNKEGLRFHIRYIEGFAEDISIEKRGREPMSGKDIRSYIMLHIYKDPAIKWIVDDDPIAFSAVCPEGNPKLGVSVIYTGTYELWASSDIMRAYLAKVTASK